MTRRVYLHVGAPKSGTTYLQRVMRHNEQSLAGQGVLVAGRTHAELVRAGFVIREDKRLRDLPAQAARSWDRIVRQVRDFPGEVAIVSYELLAGARRGQAARAIESLAPAEVHVVVTTRDLAAAVPSAWQERLKFGLTTPLEEWRPRLAKEGPRAEWGWRTMDPASVAGRWGAGLPADRVHIVTAPRGRTEPTLLWRRFAQACGIDQVSVDLEIPVVNESLGIRAVEVLRRVNEQDLGPIRGAREQSRWLRDTLAHAVLSPLDDEPMALTDEQYAEAQQRALDAAERIRAAGWQVHGDLDEMQATRREARLPGEVPAEELLDVAVRAIAGLLLELRTARTSAEGRGGVAALPVVGALTGGSTRQQVQQLSARLDAVAQEIEAERQLHERVAELSDLVTELLLPAARRDQAALGQALRRYRKESM